MIGLKGNQPTLLEDVSLYFQEFSAELPWLPERDEWIGLKAVGSAHSTITRNGAASVDTRFFVTSLTGLDRFSYAVRKHWSIENQLHWALDVIFDEDSSGARKDMTPLNLNVL